MQNIHSYIMLGWETGILNEFHTLRRNGMPLSQLMELVMFSQLYAGMRGLGHVYRAVGDLLPVFAPPPVEPVFPDGWSADAAAFKAGLEAALLARAWGVTPHWIVQGITGSANYFTGLEGMYAAYEAVDDLLNNE